MHYSYAFSALVALTSASSASASLIINNWCSTNVYIYESVNGGCNKGANGICSTASGAAPWVIAAGKGSSSELTLPWNTSGEGVSVKVATTSNWATQPSILQFEYSWTTGSYSALYWDLSDLDGSGSGLVGSPFASQNVKVSPTGAGAGAGTCLQLKCPAGALCKDAYQHPDDTDTRSCPLTTGTMWLDLCEPTAGFNNKRTVGMGFEA